MKRCYRCCATKEPSEFFKDKSRADGLMGFCKACSKANVYKNYAANPERTATYRQEYGSAYRATHLPQLADYAAKRRALILSVFDEDVDRLAVYGMAEGHCKSCKTFVLFAEMHLDHVIPLSRGGRHAYNNVQMLCRLCNQRKGAKVLQ